MFGEASPDVKVSHLCLATTHEAPGKLKCSRCSASNLADDIARVHKVQHSLKSKKIESRDRSA